MMLSLTVSDDRDAVEIVVDGRIVATVRTGPVDGELQLELPGARRATLWAEVDLGHRATSRNVARHRP